MAESDQTVPLTFEAVDKLTQTVDRMAAALDKLTGAQEDTEKAAKEAGDAQDKQGDSLSRLADVSVIATGAMELGAKAWEIGAAAYEKLSALIGASLSAWDEQSKKSGQSASALGSITEASTRLEKQTTKTLAQFGRTIERTGLVQIGMGALGTVTDALTKKLKDNEDRVRDVSIEYGERFLAALREGNQWIEQNAETIARFEQFLRATRDTLSFVGTALNVVTESAEGLFFAISAVGLKVLGELASALEYLLTAAGVEVPQALEDMRRGLDEMADASGDRAVKSLGTLIELSDEGVTKLEKIGGSLSAVWGEPTEQMRATEKAVREATKGFEAQIQRLEDQLKRARSGRNAARGDLVADPEKQAERQQAILLDYEKRILQARQAGNETYAIELERQKAVYELQLEVVQAKTQELKFQTQMLGELKIEIEQKEKLAEQAERAKQDAREQAALDDAGWREELKRDEEADARLRERYQEIKRLEAERKAAMLETIEAASARWDESFSDLGGLLSESLAQDLEGWQQRIDGQAAYIESLSELGKIDEDTKQRMLADNEALTAEMERQAEVAERQIAALERGAQAVSVFGANLAKITLLNKSFKDSQEEVAAAMGAGVQLAGALVSAFEDNIKKRAAWEAALNAAAAIAATAFALSGYPGFAAAAVGHAAAAVKFGLVASGAISAGGGGGGSVSLSGAGAGAPAALNSTTVDLDRERELTANAIAGAIAQEGRGGDIIIPIDMSNALIAMESPQAARMLGDLLRPEIQRAVGVSAWGTP